MYESSHDIFDNVRGIVFGTIIILLAILSLVLLVPAISKNATASSNRISLNGETGIYDRSHRVSGGVSNFSNELVLAYSRIDSMITSSGASVEQALSQSSQSAEQGLQAGATAVNQSVYNGARFMGQVVAGGVTAVVFAPINAAEAISNTMVVSAMIKPADTIAVPMIEDESMYSASLDTGLPTVQTAKTGTQNDSVGRWPIRGRITTHFGVPHWPYQPTHTGIDISDGRGSGITPIYAFKPGRVIDTVYSRYGLGNHVVVDHGGGITSLYAHLSSIGVQVGQVVDHDTVLGLQGSTGASTGTHLHFEIRQDNQVVDPRQFIEGHP